MIENPLLHALTAGYSPIAQKVAMSDSDDDVVIVEERPAPPKVQAAERANSTTAEADEPEVVLDDAACHRRDLHLQRTGKGRQQRQPKDESQPGQQYSADELESWWWDLSPAQRRQLELGAGSSSLTEQQARYEQWKAHQARLLLQQQWSQNDDTPLEPRAASSSQPAGQRRGSAGQQQQQQQQRRQQPDLQQQQQQLTPPDDSPTQKQKQKQRKQQHPRKRQRAPDDEPDGQPARAAARAAGAAAAAAGVRTRAGSGAAAPPAAPAAPAAAAAAAADAAARDELVRARKLRKKLSRIEAHAYANREALSAPEAVKSGRLARELQDVVDLGELARRPREAAQQTAVLALYAGMTARALGGLLRGDGRAPADLVAALRRAHAVPPSAAAAAVAGGGVAPLDWPALGRAASGLFRGVAGPSSLRGPLEARHRPAVQRQRHRAADRGEAVRPLEPGGGGDESAAGATQETDRWVSAMRGVLAAQPGRRASLAALVTNTASFGQSVENLFALSFLVKDLYARLEVEDGRVVVAHVTREARAELLQQQKALRAGGGPPAAAALAPHQFVLDLDFATWQELCRALPPPGGLMPHRPPFDEEAAAQQQEPQQRRRRQQQ